MRERELARGLGFCGQPIPSRLSLTLNFGIIGTETEQCLDLSAKARRRSCCRIERLLQVEVLAIENEQEVFTAMVALKEGRGSFADALIAELGARVGCTRTLTFERKATRLPGFELV